MYSWVSATPIVNSYPLVLVSFNIGFLKVIESSISHSLLYQLNLLYDQFLNESVFITINNFLMIAMVSILIISLAGWKFSAWIDKWTMAVSKNEQILENVMDGTTEWIFQQFSWMLQWINKCWNKWVLRWYFLFY